MEEDFELARALSLSSSTLPPPPPSPSASIVASVLASGLVAECSPEDAFLLGVIAASAPQGISLERAQRLLRRASAALSRSSDVQGLTDVRHTILRGDLDAADSLLEAHRGFRREREQRLSTDAAIAMELDRSLRASSAPDAAVQQRLERDAAFAADLAARTGSPSRSGSATAASRRRSASGVARSSSEANTRQTFIYDARLDRMMPMRVRPPTGGEQVLARLGMRLPPERRPVWPPEDAGADAASDAVAAEVAARSLHEAQPSQAGGPGGGMTEGEFHQLPAAVSPAGTVGDCVICMEELGEVVEVTRLPCMHTFHTSCCWTWLKDNATCPVCKHRVIG